MSDRKDEKWLDEAIARAINTTEPQFDAEKWKQKYPEQFKALRSRAERSSSHVLSKPWRNFPAIRAAGFALAAAIIIVVGFLVVGINPKPKGPERIADARMSPADMLTAGSLSAAYRRGGIEEIERQSAKALEMLGPRPKELTLRELLAQSNGT